MNSNELCVVNTTQMQIWTFTTEEKADYDLSCAIEQNEKDNQLYRRYCEEWPEVDIWPEALKKTERTKYEIMTFAEFNALQREKLLSLPLEEIDEVTYNEMFNILPPLCWRTVNNIEMFCMCEMFTDTYTTQYAHDKRTGKFYSKMVDVKDRETWIDNFLCA